MVLLAATVRTHLATAADHVPVLYGRAMNQLWRIGFDDGQAAHYCDLLEGVAGGTSILTQPHQGAADPLDERDDFLGNVVAIANQRKLRLVAVHGDKNGLLLFFTAA